MKLATVRIEGRETVVEVDQAAGLAWKLVGADGAPITELLAIVKASAKGENGVRRSDQSVPLGSLSYAAPIPKPIRNLFCVGKNYHEHAKEFAASGYDSTAKNAQDAAPDFPIIFSKVPECVIAHEEDIRYPVGVTDSLDYEAELAVIIGKGGIGISKADAMDHVWGYTIINDVTARDLQVRHKQWLIGKSLDTFGPMGPIAVTADEIDVNDTGIRCLVNGELRQNSNTRDLIFDIPTLIESLSAGITLLPGDIIATGTPAGVGLGFTPPKFLQVGDRVTVEIDGIGALSNVIS
jgi:2-keto-4-pentenoate hydratase/2-oxohepta-3-ene-1,7-dioic acid hydratase in catechol pathway